MDQPLRFPPPFPGRNLSITKGIQDRLGDVVPVASAPVITPTGLTFNVAYYSQDGKPI